MYSEVPGDEKLMNFCIVWMQLGVARGAGAPPGREIKIWGLNLWGKLNALPPPPRGREHPSEGRCHIFYSAEEGAALNLEFTGFMGYFIKSENDDD